MRILVTGGSGFLGRALLKFAPEHEYTVYSRDETKQYELRRRNPHVRCILGDVRDLDRLTTAMYGHDAVIHAGAVKYIPEAEDNVAETIAVNVEGSLNVASAAVRAGIETVVGISTDKACAPLNTYGATKMLMERAFAEANRWSETRFVCVRYGNVVGSTGSVIPVFQQQIADSGVLKVTDERMTRFWLSPSQAVDQVLWALIDDDVRGLTYINRCPAMKIVDLARTVAVVSGDSDVPIKITGLRPGEKLHESLFNEQEAPRVRTVEDDFVLFPATSGVVYSEVSCYSSDMPQRWITQDEMIEMIREAQSL